MNSKDLRRKIQNLSPEELAAFKSASAHCRAHALYSPAEWTAFWASNPRVTSVHQQTEVQLLVVETHPLSPKEYDYVTDPSKSNGGVGSFFKKVSGVFAIIVACVALAFGIAAISFNLLSNSSVENSLGSLTKMDATIQKNAAESDAKNNEAIKKINEALGGVLTQVDSIDEKIDEKVNEKVNERTEANAKDIAAIKDDLEKIKLDASSNREKTDAALSVANSALKKSGDTAKAVQTIVGAKADGKIGSETMEKAGSAAKKLNAQSADNQPAPDPASTQDAAPVVVTGGTSSLTTTSVVIGGKITPNNDKSKQSEWWIEYGTSSTQLISSVHQAIKGEKTVKDVSSTISNLSPNTTYNYRVVASNTKGVTPGELRSFTTAKSEVNSKIVLLSGGNCKSEFFTASNGEQRIRLIISSLGTQPNGVRVWVEQGREEANGVISKVWQIGQTGVAVDLTNTFYRPDGAFFKVLVESKEGEPGAWKFAHPMLPGGSIYVVCPTEWWKAQ